MKHVGLKQIAIFLLFVIILVGMRPMLDSLKVYHADRLNRSVGTPYLHANPNDTERVDSFHAGSIMFLHAEVLRTVPCNVDLTYRIIQSSRTAGLYRRIVYFVYPMATTAIQPGSYIIDTRFELPNWLAPGNYQLERNAIYACEGNRIDFQSPIDFWITP